MRMRKKKNLIPRMERCAPCRVQDGFALKGRWREALMPSARELRLELGCGKGRFTAETARRHPDILFIAIEKVPDALVVAMERAMDMELKNVFFVVGTRLCCRTTSPPARWTASISTSAIPGPTPARPSAA